MPPPIQGFRLNRSLAASGSTDAFALVASCGASRGAGFQLSGTFVGTISFEQSLDSGTTWIALTVYPAVGGAGVSSATAGGQWKFACGGQTHVRARCSAYTSGTIVVDAAFTAGVDTPSVVTPTTDAKLDTANQALGTVSDAPVTDGNADASINARLAGLTVLSSSTAPVAVQASFAPTVVSTKTNTLLKTGAGVLGDVWVSIVGTADSIEFFDSTNTGSPINSILKITGTPLALGLHQLLRLDFANGLVATTAGSAAGTYTLSCK